MYYEMIVRIFQTPLALPSYVRTYVLKVFDMKIPSILHQDQVPTFKTTVFHTWSGDQTRQKKIQDHMVTKNQETAEV